MSQIQQECQVETLFVTDNLTDIFATTVTVTQVSAHPPRKHTHTSRIEKKQGPNIPGNNPPRASSPASPSDPAAPPQKPDTSAPAPPPTHSSPTCPPPACRPHYTSPPPHRASYPRPTPEWPPHSHTDSNNSAPTTPSRCSSRTSL